MLAFSKIWMISNPSLDIFLLWMMVLWVEVVPNKRPYGKNWF
jgi:hypothetical protein